MIRRQSDQRRISLLRRWRQLTNGIEEGVRGPSERTVTTVGHTQLAPEFFALNRDELYASGEDLVAGKAGANERNTKPSCHETLDHANAWQFHAHLQFVCVGAEEFIHHAAAEAGFRQQHWLFRDLADGHHV